jgi:ceramide glucosyltransferase
MWGLLTVLASGAAPWSWAVLALIVMLRLAVALMVGFGVLRDRRLLRHLWLLPVRDLVAVVVWVASLAGHTVTWRGDRFELKNGQLIRIDP